MTKGRDETEARQGVEQDSEESQRILRRGEPHCRGRGRTEVSRKDFVRGQERVEFGRRKVPLSREQTRVDVRVERVVEQKRHARRREAQLRRERQVQERGGLAGGLAVVAACVAVVYNRLDEKGRQNGEVGAARLEYRHVVKLL